MNKNYLLLAGFVIALGIGMLSLNIRPRRNDYVPDQGKCFSCGRCFKYCPIKRKD